MPTDKDSDEITLSSVTPETEADKCLLSIAEGFAAISSALASWAEELKSQAAEATKDSS